MAKILMHKATVASKTSSHAFVFPSALGWFSLLCTDLAVIRLNFALPSLKVATETLGSNLTVNKILKSSQLEQLPAWIAELVLDLQAYAAGESVLFDDVPIDNQYRTKFQQRVIAECRKIARGTVKSYRELARLAGSTGAARAVGSVMATNPVPIIVPCHRVVGTNGIGGFSAPGGLDTKRKLLALEAS